MWRQNCKFCSPPPSRHPLCNAVFCSVRYQIITLSVGQTISGTYAICGTDSLWKLCYLYMWDRLSVGTALSAALSVWELYYLWDYLWELRSRCSISIPLLLQKNTQNFLNYVSTLQTKWSWSFATVKYWDLDFLSIFSVFWVIFDRNWPHLPQIAIAKCNRENPCARAKKSSKTSFVCI